MQEMHTIFNDIPFQRKPFLTSKLPDLLTSHHSFTYFIFSLTARNLHPNTLHLLFIHVFILRLILLTFIYVLLPFSSLFLTAPSLPTFSHTY